MYDHRSGSWNDQSMQNISVVPLVPSIRMIVATVWVDENRQAHFESSPIAAVTTRCSPDWRADHSDGSHTW